MKHNYFYLLILIFALFSTEAISQVETRIVSPREFISIVGHDKNDKINIISLPALDIRKIQNEDVEAAKKGAPERFGRAVPLSLGLEAGKWSLDVPKGGYRWNLGITSGQAKALLINFDDFSLPDGAEFYAYNASKTMIFGPVSNISNSSKSSRFATDLINGDTIFLELFEPVQMRGKSKLHTISVLHAYNNTWQSQSDDTPGFLLPCERDVVCPEGNNVGAEMDAVAFIFDTQTSSSCSGTLLNNACNNLQPTVLTATHCLDGGNSNPSNWSFRFKFRNSSCGGTNTTSYASVFGATEIVRSPGGTTSTDALLLQLNYKPASQSGITYAGWSRNINITGITALHHPRKHPLKVSTAPAPTAVTDQIVGSRTLSAAWEVAWGQNMNTQPGSSGSGYFDQDGRLVGQHSAGSSEQCTIREGLGGRFDIYWNEGFGVHLSDDPSVMTTNTIAIPYIDIPDDLCGDSPMNILNFPYSNSFPLSGGSIEGAHLTSFFQSIAPNPGYNGVGFIELQFSPPGITCNDPLILRKTFNVGIVTPEVQLYHNWDCSGWVYVTNVIPNTTYNWVVSYGGQTYYQQGSSVYLPPSSGSGNVYYYLEASNTCASTWVEGDRQLQGCYGPNSAKPTDATTAKNYDWKMQLSPNPATNDLNITLSDYNERLLHTLGDVKIFNMTGQVVYQSKQVLSDNMRMNIQNLNNGFYILEVRGQDFTTRQRFNVSR